MGGRITIHGGLGNKKKRTTVEKEKENRAKSTTPLMKRKGKDHGRRGETVGVDWPNISTLSTHHPPIM